MDDPFDLFSIDGSVRYVAVYRDGELEMRSREGTKNASGAETDRFEELLVNPTLLKLATQRGEIDCGGLRYLLIGYGHFFQYVEATAWGHVSVCLENDERAQALAEEIHRRVGALD